jgi:hypothetical protein
MIRGCKNQMELDNSKFYSLFCSKIKQEKLNPMCEAIEGFQFNK